MLKTKTKWSDGILNRCALLLGTISTYERSEVMRQVLGMLDPQNKTPTDEVILILQTVRYIFCNPTDKDSVNYTMHLISALLAYYDYNKKLNVRLQVIQTLERIVAHVDFHGELSPPQSKLWTQVIELHKFAKKWSKVNDTFVASIHLITRIIASSPNDYFDMHFEAYLQQDLISKDLNPYVYECILTLLRGTYNFDEYSKKTSSNLNQNGDFYSFLMRKSQDLSTVTLMGRLNLISEILFTNKSEPIHPLCLDLSADIMVQICCHSFKFGLELIGILSDTNESDLHYVVARSLRLITDPSSGFYTYAACKQEDEFVKDFENLASLFETRFERIFEQLIGDNSFEKAVHVLEPVLLKKTIHQNENEIENEQDHKRGLSDIFSEISFERDSLKKISLLSSSRHISQLDLSPSNEMLLLDAYSNATLPECFHQPVSQNNEKITSQLQDWFSLLDPIHVTPSDLCLTCTKKFASKSNFKPLSNHVIYIMTLLELIRSLAFLPLGEFISGKFFIGKFLCHPVNEIGMEASNTFQNYLLCDPCKIFTLNSFIHVF